MTSRFEKHSEFIIARLDEGTTYATLMRELADIGCSGTYQALDGWLKRRSTRIQKRQSLTNPLAMYQHKPEHFDLAAQSVTSPVQTPQQISTTAPPASTAIVEHINATTVKTLNPAIDKEQMAEKAKAKSTKAAEKAARDAFFAKIEGENEQQTPSGWKVNPEILTSNDGEK